MMISKIKNICFFIFFSLFLFSYLYTKSLSDNNYLFISIYKAGIIKKDYVRIIIPPKYRALSFRFFYKNNPIENLEVKVLKATFSLTKLSYISNKQGRFFLYLEENKEKNEKKNIFEVEINAKDLLIKEKLEKIKKLLVYFSSSFHEDSTLDFEKEAIDYCLRAKNSQIEIFLSKLDFSISIFETLKKSMEQFLTSVDKQVDLSKLFLNKLKLLTKYELLILEKKLFPKPVLSLNRFLKKYKILKEKNFFLSDVFWGQLLQGGKVKEKTEYLNFLLYFLNYYHNYAYLEDTTYFKSPLSYAYKKVFDRFIGTFLNHLFVLIQKKKWLEIEELLNKIHSFSKGIFYQEKISSEGLESYVNDLYNDLNERNYSRFITDPLSFYEKLTFLLESIVKDFPIELFLARAQPFFDFFSFYSNPFTFRAYSYEEKLKNKFFITNKLYPLLLSQLEEAKRNKRDYFSQDTLLLWHNIFAFNNIFIRNFIRLSDTQKNIYFKFQNTLRKLFHQDYIMFAVALNKKDFDIKKLYKIYDQLETDLMELANIIAEKGLNDQPVYFLLSQDNKLNCYYGSYWPKEWNEKKRWSLGDTISLEEVRSSYLNSQEDFWQLSYFNFYFPYVNTKFKNRLVLKSINMEGRIYLYIQPYIFFGLQGDLKAYINGKEVPIGLDIENNRIYLESKKIIKNVKLIYIPIANGKRIEIFAKSYSYQRVSNLPILYVTVVILLFFIFLIFYFIKGSKIKTYIWKIFNFMPKKFFYARERPLFIKLGEFIYIQYKTEKSLFSKPEIESVIMSIVNAQKELKNLEKELEQFLEITTQKDEISFTEVYKQIDIYHKNIKKKELDIERLYLKLGKVVYQYKEILSQLKQYDYIKPTIEELEKWETLEKIGLKPRSESTI